MDIILLRLQHIINNLQRLLLLATTMFRMQRRRQLPQLSILTLIQICIQAALPLQPLLHNFKTVFHLRTNHLEWDLQMEVIAHHGMQILYGIRLLNLMVYKQMMEGQLQV